MVQGRSVRWKCFERVLEGVIQRWRRVSCHQVPNRDQGDQEEKNQLVK